MVTKKKLQIKECNKEKRLPNYKPQYDDAPSFRPSSISFEEYRSRVLSKPSKSIEEDNSHQDFTNLKLQTLWAIRLRTSKQHGKLSTKEIMENYYPLFEKRDEVFKTDKP